MLPENVGRLVVEQALARGHEVVALARKPQNLQREHPNLTTGAVDILDAQALKPWLQGVDAVISTVGIGTSKPRQPFTLPGQRIFWTPCKSMGYHVWS